MPKVKDNFSFTTSEVLLVIIVIGVWVMVLLPRFGGSFLFARAKLRTAVYNITSDIRYTRGLAISNTNAQKYIIYFYFSQKEYRIYKDSVADANQVGETKKIPQEITCSGTNEFDFISLGSATFSGSGILTLSTSSGEQYQITVIAPTGTAVIQKL